MARPEEAQPTAEAAPGEIDPCALVTGAEAEQVLAAPVGAGERPSAANNEYLASCRYVAPRGQSVVVLTVMVNKAPYGRTAFQTAREQPFEPQTVAGIGDDAFWIGDPLYTLYVLKDTISLAFGGDVQLDQVRPLALKALERVAAKPL